VIPYLCEVDTAFQPQAGQRVRTRRPCSKLTFAQIGDHPRLPLCEMRLTHDRNRPDEHPRPQTPCHALSHQILEIPMVTGFQLASISLFHCNISGECHSWKISDPESLSRPIPPPSSYSPPPAKRRVRAYEDPVHAKRRARAREDSGTRHPIDSQLGGFFLHICFSSISSKPMYNTTQGL